jgi:probable rRNA maturation factor
MALPSDWAASERLLAAAATLGRYAIARTLRAEDYDAAALDVGLLLTDDETVRRLNRQYRATDAPTDVLAFAMREGVDAHLHPELLGDVVISMPCADRQAREAGHSLARELAILTIHGTLHLLGYDHDTDEEAAAMGARESALVAAVTASDAWATHAARLNAALAGNAQKGSGRSAPAG